MVPMASVMWLLLQNDVVIGKSKNVWSLVCHNVTCYCHTCH